MKIYFYVHYIMKIVLQSCLSVCLSCLYSLVYRLTKHNPPHKKRIMFYIWPRAPSWLRTIEISSSSLTVTCSQAHETCVCAHTYIYHTPTQAYEKNEKKKEKNLADTRRICVSSRCFSVAYAASFSSTPYIQAYTTGYHIRTYTQPCRC